jgi:hypothetical protein
MTTLRRDYEDIETREINRSHGDTRDLTNIFLAQTISIIFFTVLSTRGKYNV